MNKRMSIGEFKKHYNASTLFDPKYGYFITSISINNIINNWNEIHEWCKATYGSDHYTWSGNEFVFESEEDLTWFILRWS